MLTRGAGSCKDGKYLSVGALEPQFYAAFVKGLGLDPATLPDQMDSDRYPELARIFADHIAERTRDEWCAVFDGTDACVAPVLTLAEVPHHPHNRERDMMERVDDAWLPRPAPRLSRTPAAPARAEPEVGQHTEEVFKEWGVPAALATRVQAETQKRPRAKL